MQRTVTTAATRIQDRHFVGVRAPACWPCRGCMRGPAKAMLDAAGRTSVAGLMAAVTVRFPAPGVYVAARHANDRRPFTERRDDHGSVVDDRVLRHALQTNRFQQALALGRARRRRCARGRVALEAPDLEPAAAAVTDCATDCGSALQAWADAQMRSGIGVSTPRQSPRASRDTSTNRSTSLTSRRRPHLVPQFIQSITVNTLGS